MKKAILIDWDFRSQKPAWIWWVKRRLNKSNQRRGDGNYERGFEKWIRMDWGGLGRIRADLDAAGWFILDNKVERVSTITKANENVGRRRPAASTTSPDVLFIQSISFWFVRRHLAAIVQQKWTQIASNLSEIGGPNSSENWNRELAPNLPKLDFNFPKNWLVVGVGNAQN